jgi:hypothetical protein
MFSLAEQEETMKTFRAVVVAVILGSFFSPAMGMAKTEPRLPPAATQPAAPATAPVAASTANTSGGEAASYAAREQQSQGVQDFKGGAVYLYFGSGVVLALIIIILILL